jgi:hypothetical protein
MSMHPVEIPHADRLPLVINGCWVPECQNLAAVRDWAGWYWCVDHIATHAGGTVYPITKAEVIEAVKRWMEAAV